MKICPDEPFLAGIELRFVDEVNMGISEPVENFMINAVEFVRLAEHDLLYLLQNLRGFVANDGLRAAICPGQAFQCRHPHPEEFIEIDEKIPRNLSRSIRGVVSSSAS